MVEACTAPANHVANAADCDDLDADVSPAAAEVCNTRDDDCGDLVASASPAATEVCNGVDDDCDGATDDADGGLDLSTGSAGYGDSDGHGVVDVAVVSCEAPARATPPSSAAPPTRTVTPTDGYDEGAPVVATVEVRPPQCAVLDLAAGGCAATASSSGLNLGSTYTVEAWADNTGGGARYRRLLYDESTTVAAWRWQMDGDTTMQWAVGGTKRASATFSMGDRHHVAIVNSGCTLSFYPTARGKGATPRSPARCGPRWPAPRSRHGLHRRGRRGGSGATDPIRLGQGSAPTRGARSPASSPARASAIGRPVARSTKWKNEVAFTANST